MLTAAPNPRSVLPPPVAFPFCTEETPACNVARAAQSRPLSGVSRTVLALVLPHPPGQDSLASAGGATTRTTCCGSPNRSTTVRTRSTPALTEILVHNWVVNPEAET